jgi:hypothetical protein
MQLGDKDVLSDIRQVKNVASSQFIYIDHLCGLVERVPGYRSKGSGSIHRATTFSEK